MPKFSIGNAPIRSDVREFMLFVKARSYFNFFQAIVNSLNYCPEGEFDVLTHS